MSRFLGGHPVRVAVQLVLLSLLVGAVLRWLGITPLDLLDRAALVAGDLWAATLRGTDRFGPTVLLGAMVVLPLFFLNRLVSRRRR